MEKCQHEWESGQSILCTAASSSIKVRVEVEASLAFTYHSPDGPLPSGLPPLASRLAFWPAAADAKLDGRLDGMIAKVSCGLAASAIDGEVGR